MQIILRERMRDTRGKGGGGGGWKASSFCLMPKKKGNTNEKKKKKMKKKLLLRGGASFDVTLIHTNSYDREKHIQKKKKPFFWCVKCVINISVLIFFNYNTLPLT